ncbi:MAG: hypothetical protein GC204_02535 [Chloroflexi bacterium]|nr:hypothetical protein [Chloroflexota bacterium]
MSEERLYERARQRIDRNHRRWLVWGVNFIGFLLYVGALAAYSGIPRNVGETVLQAWFGALVLHTTAIVLMQDEEAGIDGEIAKVRRRVVLPPPDAQSIRLGNPSPVNGADSMQVTADK